MDHHYYHNDYYNPTFKSTLTTPRPPRLLALLLPLPLGSVWTHSYFVTSSTLPPAQSITSLTTNTLAKRKFLISKL